MKSFKYLGNTISYERELDIDNKLNSYLKVTGTLNNVFRPQKTLNKTRIKLYNTLALPVLLYGSETWTIKAGDTRRISAAEMSTSEEQQDTLGQITKQIHKLQRN